MSCVGSVDKLSQLAMGGSFLSLSLADKSFLAKNPAHGHWRERSAIIA